MENGNTPRTLIIVLHEIYGVNRHILTVSDNFRQSGYDSINPDFSGVNIPFEYEDQEAAYKHFIDKVGFVRAVQTVKKLAAEARHSYRQVFLCGYSIGATVAWLCSEDRNIDGIIGYYGSRIRDYTGISPQCPVLLLFPSHEKSFDVCQVSSGLEKSNVEIHILNGEHGFADPFSPNYSEDSCNSAYRLVREFLLKNIWRSL